MHDEFWLEEMNPDVFSAGDGIMRGDPGPYYTPTVDANGVISWTNNGSLPNPEPRNIKGPDGKSAYEQAVEGGYEGTEEEFNAELAAVAGATEQIAVNTQDISDLKSAKAPVIIDTASGAIASFPDGADNVPIKTLTVNIEPAQAGTGDPSPDNVRPISGWTAAEVSHSGEDTTQSVDTVYSFPSTAGTVYGGTLTINDDGTGVLTVDRELITLDGIVNKITGAWGDTQYGSSLYITGIGNRSRFRPTISNVLQYSGSSSTYMPLYSFPGSSGSSETCTIVLPMGTTVAQGNQWLQDMVSAGTPVQVMRMLTSVDTYQLTQQQVLNTLYGENNIWADCGDIELEYRADTKLYIQKINAPADDDMTADAQIASGKYFIIGGNLYLSTTTIPAGDTIIPGTNCTKTNLAEALNALNV